MAKSWTGLEEKAGGQYFVQNISNVGGLLEGCATGHNCAGCTSELPAHSLSGRPLFVAVATLSYNATQSK